jgi:predicted nucleotidyltransferase
VDRSAAGATPEATTSSCIAGAFAGRPEVEAVAWSGSWAAGLGSAGSDIDLYVYSAGGVPAEARMEIAARIAAGDPPAEIDNRFWETGDEWRDAASGIWVDIMYRSPAWVEDELARVLDRHEASVGYSTAVWHNVRTARILFDRRGWLHELVERANSPYPEPLRQAIIAKNLPLLRRIHSSYLTQIEAAIRRADVVAINHRIAAFLASVFDILFAVNRVTHPGEKRLLDHVKTSCARQPTDFTERVTEILGWAGNEQAVLRSIERFAAEMELLVEEANRSMVIDP